MQCTEASSADDVTITAAQVIFTNVEVEQSPVGHRGFQTVFYTENRISKEVLQSEIEPALQYFPRTGYDPENSPPEFVFFPLSSKQIAVGRITPLLNKLDKFGRKKMLFAHVLVFEASAFLDLLNNNPFVVLDADPFLRRYEDVLAQESVAPCRLNIPAKDLLLVPNEPVFISENIPRQLQEGESLLKLLLLASAAASRRKTYTLELNEQPDQLLAFMRSLFAVIPPEFRTACSFDTSFVGDTGQAKSSRSPFWATGVGIGQRLQQDAVIRIRHDQSQSELSDITVEFVTPFEKWLEERSPKFKPSIAAEAPQRRIRYSCLLQDALRGRRVPPVSDEEVEREVFDQFVRCNEQYIVQLLRKNFVKSAGEALADFLMQNAIQWIKTSGARALEAVPRRFPAEQLCNWLLPRYKKKPDYKPRPEEIEALQRCFTADEPRQNLSSSERLLRAFCLYWRANWQELQDLLATSEHDEFYEFARWSIRAAAVRANAIAHLVKKVALFFGFIGTGFSPEAKKLLRVLTFEPLQAGERVPTPSCGISSCRKVVLELLAARDTASKKKPDCFDGTGRAEFTGDIARQQNWMKPEPPSLACVTYQRSNDGLIHCIQEPSDIQPQILRSLPEILAQLCRTDESHMAYFSLPSADLQLRFFIVAKILSTANGGSLTAAVLNNFQFKQHQNDPFSCFARIKEQAEDLGTHENLDVPDVDLLALMLLLVAGKTRFRLRGPLSSIRNTIRQVFQILPNELRSRCPFYTGDFPIAHQFAKHFAIAAAKADDAVSDPVFDLATRKHCGNIPPTGETPFEKCVQAAMKHELWQAVWPDDLRVFHQFYELCKLLVAPGTVSGDERFSNPAIRIFIDTNRSQVNDALLQRLQESCGKYLGAALLSRANEWIHSAPANLIAALRDGLPKVWLVQETVSRLLYGKNGPVAEPELIDVASFIKSIRGDRSSDATLLRAAYSLLAGKVAELAYWIERFEDRDDGEYLFGELCKIGLKTVSELGGINWRFQCSAADASETAVGVTLQLHNLGETGTPPLACRLLAALFGGEVTEDDGFYKGGRQFKPCPGVSGKFWPCLIDAMHATFPILQDGTNGTE